MRRNCHDTISALIASIGPIYELRPSPTEAWATTAPEQSMNKRAYGHSLIRGPGIRRTSSTDPEPPTSRCRQPCHFEPGDYSADS
jgi:hypothetical protein